jgi:hypothetical protein
VGCSRLVKQLPDFVPQRTSCLGFGDGYNENILAAMSKVGQGQLQAADSPEKFPLILAQKRNRLNHLTGDEFYLGSVGLLRAHSRIPKAIRSRRSGPGGALFPNAGAANRCADHLFRSHAVILGGFHGGHESGRIAGMAAN